MKQHKLSITLVLITVCIFTVWAWSYAMNTTATASLPWEIYNNGLYLSGLLSIALMSITMMLATRPAWLETPFNGIAFSLVSGTRFIVSYKVREVLLGVSLKSILKAQKK
ncbi:MAG: hypothetical protein KBT75_01980 [Oleispira antarctica]|nr:hypothetical protein [Oleispira antarctica]MBQ0793030.1 hypothetical protein [Oleispira antarctica]